MNGAGTPPPGLMRPGNAAGAVVRLRFSRGVAAAAVALVGASAALLMLAAARVRPVIVPALVCVWIAAVAGAALWRRERQAPLLDIGALTLAATALYAGIPALGFVLTDLDTLGNDPRVMQYDPDYADLAPIFWYYAAYVAGLAVAYLLLRRRARPAQQRLSDDRSRPLALGLVYVGMAAIVMAIQAAYGLRFEGAYARLTDLAATVSAMPLVARQMMSLASGTLLVIKLGLLLTAATRPSRAWRWIVAGLLAWELWQAATVGSRSDLVLFVLGAALVYHGRVRPIRRAVLVAAGGFGLLAFLVFGIYRLLPSELSATDKLDFVRGAMSSTGRVGVGTLFSTSEFSAVFGTAFDLLQRRISGALTVPWQVYASDFVALIPSQLLPFTKMDAANWYIDLVGLRDAGVGFVFGVAAQGAVGLGLGEMAVRGLLLGAMLAGVHRWWAERTGRFWVNVAYLWLCVMCYYSVRASTLYLLQLFLFRLGLGMLATEGLASVLRRHHRSVTRPNIALDASHTTSD